METSRFKCVRAISGEDEAKLGIIHRAADRCRRPANRSNWPSSPGPDLPRPTAVVFCPPASADPPLPGGRCVAGCVPLSVPEEPFPPGPPTTVLPPAPGRVMEPGSLVPQELFRPRGAGDCTRPAAKAASGRGRPFATGSAVWPWAFGGNGIGCPGQGSLGLGWDALVPAQLARAARTNTLLLLANRSRARADTSPGDRPLSAAL